MNINGLTRALVLAVALLVWGGCGRWPPIVETKADVDRLSASEPSVRARGLADSDIQSLARLRQLRILDFSGGRAVKEAKITDAGLAHLSKLDLPHLERLRLGYCSNVTDAGLLHVGQMHTVAWLSLMACPQITDKGLPHLLTMKRLRELDLRGCPGITDAGLQYLLGKTNWQTISLGGCPNVTTGAVARLQAALPNARVEKDEKEWSSHK